MKKINGLLLSTITAAFLVGCGGGGGSSSSTSTTPSTGTDVSVERGPVYKATVTDANGQVATQKSGKNVYTFATTPVYPITATGGFVDVDGDGQISAGDIELTTVLTSYSNVVTPITTYLGDTTTTEGKTKLAKLKEISGVTDDNDLLKKVPSELSTDVIVLTNALFDIMNDGDTSNDDFVSDYNNSAFKTKVTELKTLVSSVTDTKEIMKTLEQKVVTNLGLTKLTSDDATAANNATTTATLKVADLTRFVSYKSGDNWYDDNTVANGKVTFKSYKFNKWNSVIQKSEWVLDETATPYITITPNTTNLYKLSYVDPNGEEGTFKILSTKPVDGYTDLFVSKVENKVSKKATAYDWYKWDWKNPTIGNSTTPITNNDELYTYLTDRGTSSLSYTKETDMVSITSTDGKEHSYYRLVKENADYYIEQADVNDVGYIEYDTIYTGSELDTLIEKINAPAPTFKSANTFSVDENQTSAFTAKATSGAKIIYSLVNGSDSYFNIDSSTGVVTFKTAPDYEKQTSYYLYVEATNKLNGLATTQNVMVLINNVVDEQSTISEATSFVSGKTIVLNDQNSAGYMTLIFDANGNYEERGFESQKDSNNQDIPYTCYGKWKDLGNNKIAGTCDEGANYVRPEVIGNVMGNNGEIHLTFSDKTLSVGSNVTVDFKNDSNAQDQVTDTIKSVM